MRLNLSFKYLHSISLWLFVLYNIQAHSLNIMELPKEVRQSFTDFLSPQFDETKALKEWSHIKNGQRIYHLKYPDDMDSPTFIGYSHKKNTKVFHAGRTVSTILFESQYEFDEHGRRIIGVERKETQNKHLVIAGCSFAMGTSLSDDETLAFQLAKASEQYYPVNLGVAGSGTNTMLAMMRHNLKKESIFSEKGKFIYIYLDFHITRANAFAMEREWLWDTPQYKKNSDARLEYRGNFKKSEPMWTSFYSTGQLLLRKLGIQFNYPKLSSKHINYTCDLIKETKRDYLHKFRSGEFVVYAHPYSKPNAELIKCLENSDIRLLKSELAWGEGDTIKYDDHPTGEANRKIVQELMRKLNL